MKDCGWIEFPLQVRKKELRLVALANAVPWCRARDMVSASRLGRKLACKLDLRVHKEEASICTIA